MPDGGFAFVNIEGGSPYTSVDHSDPDTWTLSKTLIVSILPNNAEYRANA